MLLVLAVPALQIIDKLESVRVNKQGIPIEVALTQDMHHLGVLRSLAWGVGQAGVMLAADDGD